MRRTNDWAGFVKIQGGFNRPRKSHTIRLLKVYSDKPGPYAEALGWQIHGVEHGNLAVPTPCSYLENHTKGARCERPSRN